MSTALTPCRHKPDSAINETAPDFNRRDPQGTIRSMNGSGTDGRFCFRIRRTSRPYAPRTRIHAGLQPELLSQHQNYWPERGMR